MPRDAVAQLLDYASWVHKLSYADIALIYAEKNAGADSSKAYATAMGTDALEELSGDNRLLLVASPLDPESERIMNCLSCPMAAPQTPCSSLTFQDGGAEFLARSWLIDPSDLGRKPECFP